MPINVGEIFVQMRANTATLSQDFDKAAKISFQFSKDIHHALSSIGQGLSLAAAIEGFKGLIEASVELGDQLSKTAEKTGLSVEALSGLEHAAHLADLSNQDLTLSIARFSKQVEAAAQGTKAAEENFKRLGIAIKDSHGQIIPTEELLGQVASRFAGMQDGAEKTGIAMQLFGRAGFQLIPFLNQGQAGLAAATEEARRMGIIMSGETAEGARKLTDDFKNLKEQSSALGVGLLGVITGPLTGLVEKFLSAMDAVHRFGIAYREEIAAIGQAIKTGLTIGLKIGGITPFMGPDPRSTFGSMLSAGPGSGNSSEVTGYQYPRPAGPYLPPPTSTDKAAEKAAEDLKKLIAQFNAALRPADEFSAKLKAIGNSDLYSLDQIINVYGKDLDEATQKQIANGQAVTGLAAGYEALFKALRNHVDLVPTGSTAAINLASSEWLAYQKIVIGATTQSAEAEKQLDAADNTVIGNLRKRINDLKEAYSSLGLQTQADLEAISAASQKAYAASGLAAEQGSRRELTARIAMLQNIRNADDAGAGKWTKEQSKGLTQALEQLDRMKTEEQNAAVASKLWAQETKKVFTDLSRGIADSIVNFQSFGDTVKKIFQDLATFIIENFINKALLPLTKGGGFLDTLFGAVSGGFGGGAAFNTPFNPPLPSVPGLTRDSFRAGGGPVMPSMPYVVGERGPELFMPSTAGNIIPASAFASSSSPNMVVNIDARGAQQGVAEQIARVVPGILKQALINQREYQLRTT